MLRSSSLMEYYHDPPKFQVNSSSHYFHVYQNQNYLLKSTTNSSLIKENHPTTKRSDQVATPRPFNSMPQKNRRILQHLLGLRPHPLHPPPDEKSQAQIDLLSLPKRQIRRRTRFPLFERQLFHVQDESLVCRSKRLFGCKDRV